MVDVAEHVYDDDPGHGHPDVRTRLAGASYFLLWQRFVQAAVQYALAAKGRRWGCSSWTPTGCARSATR